ncbi:hypothetical protein ACFRR7_19560 [Streptomyces sp. NPDC056909]|uniref:hypothetical protein n=1 Tax=Streptomyces sp. NPDC056909 TaxID=3345963 RepID=UPI00367BF6EB
MRTFIGGHEAAGEDEDFRALFLGGRDESPEQRAVRQAAARDVFADLLEESANDEIAMLNAAYAAQLSSIVIRPTAGALPKPKDRLRDAA